MFFRAGRQAQQPNNQKPPEAEAPEVEDLEDLIVDDSSIENVNDHGGRAPRADLDARKKRPSPAYDNDAATNRPSLQNGSQRFKIPEHASTISITTGTSGDAKAKPSVMDMRPWAEKYGPTTLEELMVHQRKVSDVCKWLEDALRGHDYKVCFLSGNRSCTTVDCELETFDSQGPFRCRQNRYNMYACQSYGYQRIGMAESCGLSILI